MSRYTVSEGIVIRRTVLPSGDVVATLLSEHGTWRAIARKGRLPGGNLGRLSLFHDVTVQAYRRRDDDLAVLTQIRLNGALPNLALPEVYPYAHLLAELADALTTDVHIGGDVHTTVASGLRGLNRHPDPSLVALAYAWRLLGSAGLAPEVRHCVHCRAPGPLTHLDIPAGGVSCARCARGVPLDGDRLAEFTLLASGRLHAVLRDPPRDHATHWTLLARYVAFHVHPLRSLDALTARGAAPAVPSGAPAVPTVDDA